MLINRNFNTQERKNLMAEVYSGVKSGVLLQHPETTFTSQFQGY
jgi:hypothetical protein